MGDDEIDEPERAAAPPRGSGARRCAVFESARRA